MTKSSCLLKQGSPVAQLVGYTYSASRRRFNAVFIFLLLAVLCNFDKFILGKYAFIDFYDTVEVHYGHFQNMASLLERFGLFGWYPFNAGGVPSFVGQHQPYHLAVLLSAILPIWALSLFWNISMMSIAGFGMFNFLRISVHTDDITSFFLASIFALSFSCGNVHIAFPYLFPEFFVLTVQTFGSGLNIWSRILRSIILLLFSMLSFPVLTLPHFPVLHLILVLWICRKFPDYKKQIRAVFIVWTSYVLLFTPNIFALYEYIPLAQRNWNFHEVGSYEAIKSYIMAFKGRLTEQHFFTLLVFTLPFAFKDKSLRFYGLIVLGVLLVSSIFGSELKYLLRDSFIIKMDLFLSSMIVGIPAFLFIARGLSAFPDDKKQFYISTCCAGVSLLFLRGEYRVVGALCTLLASIGFLLATKRIRSFDDFPRNVAISFITIGLVGFFLMNRQQYMLASRYVPYAQGFEHGKWLEPIVNDKARPFRVACIDLHPAVAQAHGLDTVGGKGPLFNKYYKQYLRAVIDPQLFSDDLARGFDSVWRQLYLTRNRADDDQRPIVLSGPSRSAKDFNITLLASMNVRYLVAARPMLDMDGVADLVIVDAGRRNPPAILLGTGLETMYELPLWVYRLRSAKGRGYLANAVLTSNHAESLLKAGELANSGSISKVYIALPDIPDEYLGVINNIASVSALQDAVSLDSWSPDRLVFSGKASTPTLLVVSNNFDKGWSAKVNGMLTPVLRANVAYQAVPIQYPGPFKIELDFHTPAVWWLHVASFLGCLLMFSNLCIRDPQVSPYVHARYCPMLCFNRSSALCLLAGFSFVVVWTISFYYFVYIKARPELANKDALLYALWTMPASGAFVACWVALVLGNLGAVEKTQES